MKEHKRERMWGTKRPPNHYREAERRFIQADAGLCGVLIEDLTGNILQDQQTDRMTRSASLFVSGCADSSYREGQQFRSGYMLEMMGVDTKDVISSKFHQEVTPFLFPSQDSKGIVFNRHLNFKMQGQFFFSSMREIRNGNRWP